MVESIFKEEGLNWNQCCSACTDGAPTMFDAYQGFVQK
jgi:hypothetical protein